MTFKTFLKNHWSNIALILILLLVLGVKIQKETVATEPWCVQWEGGVTRETMVYYCYNFANQTINCDWSLLSDQSMIIYEYGNSDEVYEHLECTNYAQTLKS